MSKDDISNFNDMVDDITSSAGLGEDNVESVDEINEYGDVLKEAKTEDTESVETKEEVEEPSVELKEEEKEEVKTEEEETEDFELNAEEKELDQSQTDESEKYVPNLKYSVRGEEKEIPEYLKSAIVNAESEEQIRDMLTKVDGIDGIKESRDKAVSEVQEFATKYQEAEKINNEHDEYYNSLNNLIKGKDWDNFYKHAGIKENDILDHAEEILRRRAMSPSEVASIQRNAEVRMENIHMEKQTQEISRERDDTQARLDRIEVETTFNNSEISQAEAAFDERYGEKGSFRKAVAEIGNAAWNTPNRLSVLEACQEAIKRYGVSNNVNPTPAATEAPVTPKENAPVAGVEKRVVVRNVDHIPSAKHNASKTPVKRVVRDVEDMLKEADEYLTNNN